MQQKYSFHMDGQFYHFFSKDFPDIILPTKQISNLALKQKSNCV